MATANYYQLHRARLLELARIYREKNRAEINRKQRERYQDASTGYRGYLLSYQREYKRLYFHGETNASER
jgi:CHASE3 domain sensor protein